MKLYFVPFSCSLSPQIILEESGLKYDSESVDLKAKTTKSGANFLTINPKGQVPCLVLDDGTVLTEGAAINQYIADLVPEKELIAPVKNINRYSQVAWLNFIGTELHKNFIPFFRESDEKTKEATAKLLSTKFDYINNTLEGNDYLVGNKFSIADAYLFTVLRWTKAIQPSVDLPSNLVHYMKRMADLPAVQRAMDAQK